MKQKIWIMHHYATDCFYNKGGRPYWFAEHLLKKGYSPVVFSASTRHNSTDHIDINHGKYMIKKTENIPFVFVKTPKYTTNGLDRILNMGAFYKNVIPAAKRYAKYHGKPDAILASSAHPFTVFAGIKLAKKFGVPCICEVRDLWPESIVAYGMLNKKGVLAKALYKGEKRMYKKSDAIIMTWEGGKDYISEQGWSNDIDLSKVHHINNGVVIEAFDENSETYPTTDRDLNDASYKNIVYAGSIRKVNNLGLLLDAAKFIQNNNFDEQIRFLIYGAGDEADMLQKRCEQENITNVIFKGRVEKKYIPGILEKAHVNILHNSSTSLNKYGQSQGKLFEYLAAGKPIVQTYKTGYSIIEKYNCGISAPIQNAEEIANAVLEVCKDYQKHYQMGNNARKAAYDYDFDKLTDKLIRIVEPL
ncbi:glycosyltransferase family 4 protein [Virgibacillus halodenitrificans]|uniref:glycosyltransferase family 4 protein n=1 Tax=Virgibacillus halodenitrificans TaxID=1482 RepID=UPI000EF4B9A5|nr:glycosyltransferase family 4 protein [Virgibacillus halodenitrificans]MCG1027060.1 glycosyltransferase family 4 protein [Virgibacillus halodenitrificans]